MSGTAVMISSISPKYVIAKSVNSLPNPMDEFLKFKSEPVTDSDCIKSESITDSDVCSVSSSNGSSGRKRKLDHLSQEEKVQRKKLKNRVAAQTSRDRKKAKMEDMEYKIATQASEIKTLADTCKSLKKEKDEMKQTYVKLERRCIEMERKLAEQDKELKQTRLDADIASRVIGSVTNTNGSAVSYINPLPQGLVAQSIMRNVRNNSTDHVTALLKVITLCMVYKTGSKDAMSTNLKNLPIASWEKLQPKWRKEMPPLRAMTNPNWQPFQNPLLDPQWEPQPMTMMMTSNDEPIWM